MKEHFCSYKLDFDISAPCDSINGAVRTTCRKAKPPKFFEKSNLRLDYKAILDLCENKIMSIKFFEICKESMISVQNLEIEK